MRIRGLLNFLNDYTECWLNIEDLLPNTNGASNSPGVPLIIDGKSIAYLLSESDSLCGGQLMSYYEKVQSFYLAVIKSGFTPIVVHHDIIIQEKQELIIKLVEESMIEYNNAIYGQQSVIRLSALGRITYEQVLKDLKIIVISCDCEKYQVIASLAMAFNAPVLSNDHDFYVIHLRGVMNINKISFTSGKLVGQYFNFQLFLKFTGLKYCMMPLLVVMLTNDLIPPDLRDVLNDIVRNKISGYIGYPVVKVIKCLCNNNSPDHIISSIRTHIPTNLKTLFDEYYRNTQQRYISPELAIKINTAEPYYGLKYNVIIDHSHYALEHLIDLSWSWDTIIRGICSPRSQAEDYSMNQACICSRYIRSCRNSVLLKDKREIIELKRTTDMKLLGMTIPLPDTLSNNVKIPKLDEVINIEENKRYEMVYQILTECTNSSILAISDLNWRIIACMLVHWVNNCFPKPDLYTLKSVLIACFITNIELKGVAVKHCIPTDFKLKINRNLTLLHQLAQWQSVIYDTIRLLQALKLPIVEPHLFYNGDILFSTVLYTRCQASCMNTLFSPEENKYIELTFAIIFTQAAFIYRYTQ